MPGAEAEGQRIDPLAGWMPIDAAMRRFWRHRAHVEADAA